MNQQVDVLVVGAGPAGSAVAWGLVRRGVTVLVVDRASSPRDKACAEYLSPEAVRQLDRLGIVADLEAAGAHPVTGTTVIGPGGSRLTGLFARAGHSPFRITGLAVSRRILDSHLVRAAREAGAEVAERTTFQNLLYEDGAVAGAVVRDAAGRRYAVRSRLTIGADGLRSMVARSIGDRHHGAPSRVAFVAHVADVPGLNGVAEMHVGT